MLFAVEVIPRIPAFRMGMIVGRYLVWIVCCHQKSGVGLAVSNTNEIVIGILDHKSG